MMSSRGLVLPALTTGLFVLISCSGDELENQQSSESTSKPNVSDTTQTPASADINLSNPYWKAYRTILVKAVWDSAGNVKQVELLHSFASPAESDSVVSLTHSMKLDPKNPSGRIQRWKSGEVPTDDDIHFVVPFSTANTDSAPRSDIPTREELEGAGLVGWLSIWDQMFPEWPPERWAVSWTGTMYKPSSDYPIDDATLLKLDLVSTSPNGVWRLHPFLGVGVDEEGIAGRSPDTGYLLYRVNEPHEARQKVSGTPVSYTSAEWLDKDRFVVTGTHAVGLNVQGKYVDYIAPMICFGHVDSMNTVGLMGPPIPISELDSAWDRLRVYRRARYPKLFPDQ